MKVADANANKQRRAQVELTYLSKKSSGEMKGRIVFNGKPTREHLGKEESASPTATMELIFLMCVINAYEHRDIMLANVPNAFIQEIFLSKPGEDRTIMKITGKVVDSLVNMHPEVHVDYAVMEK